MEQHPAGTLVLPPPRRGGRRPTGGGPVMPLPRGAAPVAVVVVAGLLLLTMGAAVVAAPVTIPLLLWVARSRRGPLRAAATVVASLTAAELAWAVVYVVAAESEPAIWAVPVVAGVVTAAGAMWPRSAASTVVKSSAGRGRANR